jgi:hypothetical protein
MIPQAERRIKRRSVPELGADQNEYSRILDDMVENSGPLIPDPNWLRGDDVSKAAETYNRDEALHVALSEEAYRSKFSKMKELMKAWIGTMEPPNQGAISRYCRLLGDNDPLGLWRANIEETGDRIPLMTPDLGSMMDLNLLYAFSASAERRTTKILEVGGGYGRLAEAAFNIFGHSVKYVMIDAVPASLYYSRKYLANACPDARIGSFYDRERDGFNLDDYDIAIVPAWHFQRINKSRYDICVNIESMQEMGQQHVDYYLQLFDSLAVDGATIYISNAHDYYFRGSFNYPNNWQKLLCSNTPRSWNFKHPTEIFRKTSHDYSLQNAMVDSIYNYGLWRESDPEMFIARTGCRRMISATLRKIAKTVEFKLQRNLTPVR